jgi:hypothetical protein
MQPLNYLPTGRQPPPFMGPAAPTANPAAAAAAAVAAAKLGPYGAPSNAAAAAYYDLRA